MSVEKHVKLCLTTDGEGPCTIKVYGPEDDLQLRRAEEGERLNMLVWDFIHHFLSRKVRKGEHAYKTADEALEGVWEYLWAALQDAGISLDD